MTMLGIILFLLAYPFTKKINAVGISNLPAALKAYRRAKSKELKHNAKRRMQALLLCLLHSSVVFSAVFGRYPRLIMAHSIVCILLTVRDSVDARQEEEEEEEEERVRLKADQHDHHQQQGGAMMVSITGRLRDWMFGSSDDIEDDTNKGSNTMDGSTFNTRSHENSIDDNGDNSKSQKSRTAKAQKAVKKTKSILRGKRDSATDDVIWGAFQVSFVLLNQTIGEALAYAWLLFILTVLEEALLNPKLSKRMRMKRFLLVMATGLIFHKLILSNFCGFWLRLGRHLLSLASLSS